MNSESQKAKDIFVELICNVAPEEWEDRLLDASGGDQEVLIRVRALLRAHAEPGSFLEESAVAHQPDPTVDQPSAEQPGAQIGPYKLLQQIGEGGMGSVWMAEQHEPVRRRVALKLIKPGMDSRQVLARFEAERQALSMMDHPNIAKVLDAGTTTSSRPYFVMELVKGQPITQYCDEQRLAPQERLELFLPVCHAIQHAHQKGIIHRDIKPSNVLVAEYDGRPVAKVIDFGVAKAVHQPLTEKTMFTGLGQIIGTLEYMSPEQARVNQLDIDTRSDVYSLGVLLYELLTGSTPFDKQRMRDAALDELLRIIREEEPQRPSIKLSSSATLPSIAANRRTEPARLSILVRGELDWIVMKALEKERNRRYETANSFALDIQRYLSDEAVLACPPSAAYRFRKFARRNKFALGTSGAISAALIVGLIGTSWQAYVANQERNRAATAEEVAVERLRIVESQKRTIEEQRQKAVAEARRADREAERARTEAAISIAVSDFLNEDLLGMAKAESQVESNLPPNPNIKLRTVLDHAAKSIEGRFTDQPLVEAAIRHTIGKTYRAVGDYQQAEQHIKRALELRRPLLGEKDADTLNSMKYLAIVYMDQGRFYEASPLNHRTLEIYRKTLGNEHADTLGGMNDLAILYRMLGQYDKAERLLQEALDTLRRTGREQHTNAIRSLGNLANVFQIQGRYDEAEKLLLQTLDLRRETLGDDHPHTVGCMCDLGRLYAEQGRHDEAEQWLRRALDLSTRNFGEEHPQTLTCMHNLAALYAAQSRDGAAEALHQQTLEILSRTLGEKHLDTCSSMAGLASIYLDQRRFDEAADVLQEVLENNRQALGDEHPGTLTTMGNLAIAWNGLGRSDEAEMLTQKTLEISQRMLGVEHPDTLKTMHNLASLYYLCSRYDEAEQLSNSTLEIRRKVLGDEHPDTVKNMHQLGQVYHCQGRYDEAKLLYQEALDIRRRKWGDAYPAIPNNVTDLARLFRMQGRFSEALQLYKEALDIRRKALGEEHADTLVSMMDVAIMVAQQGRLSEAEALFRQTLETRRRTLGDDHPDTLESMRCLALAQGRYEDAAKLGQQKLESQRKTLGEDNPETLDTMAGLAAALLRVHQRAAAEKLFVEAFEISQRVFHAEHPQRISYKKRLQDFYTNAAWHFAMASDVQQRNPAEAVRLARAGVELAPDDANLQANLGVALLKKGEFREAVDALETAREMRDGSDSDHQFFLAAAYWQVGRPSDALREYREASDRIIEKKLRGEQLRFRAEAEGVIGEAAVLQEYADRIAAQPESPDLYLDRAEFHGRRQRFAAAASDCLRAFDLIIAKSNSLWWGPPWDFARQIAIMPDIAAKLEAERPDDTGVQILCLRMHLMNEHWDWAEVLLEKILAKDPEHLYAQTILAFVNLQQQDFENHGQICSKILEQGVGRPHKPDVDRILCACLLSLSLKPEQLEQIQKMAKENVATAAEFPKHASQFIRTKGWAAFRRADYEQSREWLTQALDAERQPVSQATCELLLAMTEFNTGNLDQARGYYQRGVHRLEQNTPSVGNDSRLWQFEALILAEQLRREADTLLSSSNESRDSVPRPDARLGESKARADD